MGFARAAVSSKTDEAVEGIPYMPLNFCIATAKERIQSLT
jgi:hypothetical protein